MQYLSNYLKSLYKKAFCQQNSDDFFKEKLGSLEQCILFSCFKTQEILETRDNMDKPIHTSYELNRVYIANDFENVFCIQYSGLPYQYLSSTDKIYVVNFKDLNEKTKEQIINHSEKSSSYETLIQFKKELKLKICEKKDFLSFDFPVNEDIYKKMNSVFFKTILNKSLETKDIKEKLVKI